MTEAIALLFGSFRRRKRWAFTANLPSAARILSRVVVIAKIWKAFR